MRVLLCLQLVSMECALFSWKDIHPLDRISSFPFPTYSFSHSSLQYFFLCCNISFYVLCSFQLLLLSGLITTGLTLLSLNSWPWTSTKSFCFSENKTTSSPFTFPLLFYTFSLLQTPGPLLLSLHLPHDLSSTSGKWKQSRRGLH